MVYGVSMATISSPGLATNGLDVKNIISKLVALEQKPLDRLKSQGLAIDAKISTIGQIKSLVSTLADTSSRLSSVTGWNGVTTTSSDSKYVSATAVGGTLPGSFSVEVQDLAKSHATASAALLPIGKPVGQGSLLIEIGPKDPALKKFTSTAGKSISIDVSRATP